MEPDLAIGNAEQLDMAVLARILRPPVPVDLGEWAVRNVRFGPESPFPGRYDPDRFPFYRRILDVLSPEHPARVVVLRGSAQIGKTVLAEVFLGGTQDLDPGPFLYVHPTEIERSSLGPHQVVADDPVDPGIVTDL